MLLLTYPHNVPQYQRFGHCHRQVTTKQTVKLAMGRDAFTSDPLVFHVGLVTGCLGLACCAVLFVLAVLVPKLRTHPESIVLFIAFCGLCFNLRGVVRAGLWEDWHASQRIHEKYSWLVIEDECKMESLWANVRTGWFGLECALAIHLFPRAPCSSGCVRP